MIAASIWREGDMTIGVGNLIAVICIVISIIFAIVTNQATNALWWALLAIFACCGGEHARLGFRADSQALRNEGIG
jgi:hypothetical protein